MADAANGPRTAPLTKGTRVRHVNSRRVGTITGVRQHQKRWVYVVQWDDLDHESGEYGINSFDHITRFEAKS